MTASCIYRRSKEVSFSSQRLETVVYKSITYLLVLIFLIILLSNQNVYAQQFQSPSTPYVSKSSIFRQEIARLEITVQRAGKQAVSLTQVPRVQAGDVLKVRMLDEAVGGIKKVVDTAFKRVSNRCQIKSFKVKATEKQLNRFRMKIPTNLSELRKDF